MVIHILHLISTSKDDKKIKLGYLKEYNMRDIVNQI